MQIIKIKVKGFLDSLTFRSYTAVADKENENCRICQKFQTQNKF
jgi:hypothetical protein